MTRRLVTGALVGALAAVFSAGVAAQMKADPKSYVPGVAGCNTTNCGYWLSATGTPDNNVVKSGTYNGGAGLSGNLCWRTGYWAPSMAIEQCDPDLVPKPAPVVAPPPPPPPAPPPPPPPPAPQVQKITLASKALFDFDKAVLKPEGKAAIDSEIISKLSGVQKLELVLVTGHTDPIGIAGLQPEAVGAPCRRGPRLPGLEGCRRRTRSRRSAWARRSRSRVWCAIRRT